jgi:hypothetical protein
MNFLLVAMLAGLWIWLLSPGVLRDRRPRSPLASVDSFERYMDTLAPLSDPSAPGPVHGPARRPPRPMSPQRRRQLVLSRLLAALAVTLPIALLFGGWTWALPAVAATLVAAYVIGLAVFARRARLHARVRPLPAPERQAPTTAEADRRAREA